MSADAQLTAPLADARWPDVAGARRDVLIVPIGSLEQHGPHLPMDTDSVVATAVAERVRAARAGSGLAPCLPVGASGEHADFPGTLSIGTDAVVQVVVELVRHATPFWPAVLVVNGHGGNLDALRRAEQVCADEGRALGVVHLGLPGSDAHAGRTETSLLLHLCPDRVRLDLAEPGRTDRISDLLPELRERGVRAVSGNGVLGDPTGANAVEGAQLLERLVAVALRAYDLTCPGASPAPSSRTSGPLRQP